MATPNKNYDGTHLCTWMERGTVTVNVNCLTQEQTQRPQPAGLKSRQLDPEFMELNCKH